MEKVTRTEAQWRELLSPAQYQVLRQAGTEAAVTGEYTDTTTTGVCQCRVEARCARCDSHLGHVFTGEGYDTPTGERWCIIDFELFRFSAAIATENGNVSQAAGAATAPWQQKLEHIAEAASARGRHAFVRPRDGAAALPCSSGWLVL